MTHVFYMATCGLGLVAMYVQRNPQESLHKPQDDAVAQVIHQIILIVLIVRLTHVRIRLLAMLSVKVNIEWEKLTVRQAV